MQTEIIIAGFGGQGILFAGKMLAYAGLDDGKNVTWLPSYGPEMRGGTANVTVIISDEEIGSPITRQPRVAIVFNAPSMEKYEMLVKRGGVLVYNCSLIESSPKQTDISYYPVPATDIAQELDNVTMANMVALGAMVTATQIVSLATIVQVLSNHLPASKQPLLRENEQALQRGAALVESIRMRS